MSRKFFFPGPFFHFSKKTAVKVAQTADETRNDLPMAISRSRRSFLILFLCLIVNTTTASEHSWHDSKVLINFGDNFVRGISQYGSLLGIALRDEIVFEKPSDAKGAFAVTKAGTLKIDEYLIGESRFLEFKIINENAVLLCNSVGCRSVTSHLILKNLI